jgi:hypothetical protein
MLNNNDTGPFLTFKRAVPGLYGHLRNNAFPLLSTDAIRETYFEDDSVP